MIKYFSKLYIPENHFAIYRYKYHEGLRTPYISNNLNELINRLRKTDCGRDTKYIEIELYNLDADDRLPPDILRNDEQILELRKHAVMRRLFFSSSLNQLYGESFHLYDDSFFAKIDYSYLYGSMKNKFKEGDIVSTSILRDEIIPNTDNERYGRVKLVITSNKSSTAIYKILCGFDFTIYDPSNKYTEIQSALEYDDYRPVIPVSTLKKIEGE